MKFLIHTDVLSLGFVSVFQEKRRRRGSVQSGRPGQMGILGWVYKLKIKRILCDNLQQRFHWTAGYDTAPLSCLLTCCSRCLCCLSELLFLCFILAFDSAPCWGTILSGCCMWRLHTHAFISNLSAAVWQDWDSMWAVKIRIIIIYVKLWYVLSPKPIPVAPQVSSGKNVRLMV